MSQRQAPIKAPSAAQIRRAVLTSTAIETGQSLKELKAKLKEPGSRIRRLTLA